MSHSCPSCGAPLDDEGICTACGALARGFFGSLDLGVPQVADAVQRGLDFYRLLEVATDADTRGIARRYRQLRAFFPDNPAGLRVSARRRLALLDVAGRVLTDPQLRRTYDALRAQPSARSATTIIRCVSCAAPLAPQTTHCPFCGTLRPVQLVAPAAPPAAGAMPPPTEPVDYYAMLGLTPAHLFAAPMAELAPRVWRVSSALWGEHDQDPPPRAHAPPSPDEVDAAALEREQSILLMPHMTPDEREARGVEVQIARHILRADRQRSLYDGLLSDFQQGKLDGGRLDGLRALQDWARAEIAIVRGDAVSEHEGAALLRQALGYLEARLPREAAALLQRAVAALPRAREAHAAYVRALLAAEDPLDASPHTLRQLLHSLTALDELGAPLPNGAALAALGRGLLARADGDPARAEMELTAATQHDARLAAAWRGLAALALAHGDLDAAQRHAQRALTLDARDERALLLLTGACLRAGRRGAAHEAAAQLAALRGDGRAAADVLRELAGS